MAGMSYQNQMAMSMSPGSGYVDPNSAPLGSLVDRARLGAMGAPSPYSTAYAGGGGGGSARVDAARNSMYALAKGNLADVKGDPVDAMIRQQLMARSQPGSGPYDQATQNAMLTAQANQASAAERAGMRHLQGNPNDPSYRAQQQQLRASRQGSLQDARLNIAQNANVQNYTAQGNALNALNAQNSGYRGRVTGANSTLAGMYANESADSASGAGAGGGSYRQSIMPGGSGGGPGGSAVQAGGGTFGDDKFFTPAAAPANGGMVYGTPGGPSAKPAPTTPTWPTFQQYSQAGGFNNAIMQKYLPGYSTGR